MTSIPFRVVDFLRVASMPNIDETYGGLGYCAVSRALELAQIMFAVYSYNLEALGAQAPKGLLLLQNIDENQWDTAMSARKGKLQESGLNYYSAVAVIATLGGQAPDAKLIALSNLPEGFDEQTWTSMLMYGYALCFGYDPSEFYPVQFGALGRGTEMEIQHEKATGKGGRNFSLLLQEQLQREDIMPPSILFQFDERDEQAEAEQALAQQAWQDLYKSIFDTAAISPEQYLSLLAKKNIIPEDWANVTPSTTGTDEAPNTEDGDIEEGGLPASNIPVAGETSAGTPIPLRTLSKNSRREYLLTRPHIHRALDIIKPGEPLVSYIWPKDQLITLWDDGNTLLDRQSFPAVPISSKTFSPRGEVHHTHLFLTLDDAQKAAIEKQVYHAISRAAKV